MPHVEYWARVRELTDSCPLRRGAWYRVVDLTPVEAMVEVNHRLLHIPRDFVEILPLRPPVWSVLPVLDNRGEAIDGRWVGVCPGCCARAPLQESESTLRCPRCGAVFAVAWSDAEWRGLEVLSDATTPGTLARARARALRALAIAFGLNP